jgi:RNA polymerase sigma-70 factor (ECF subfamily)
MENLHQLRSAIRAFVLSRVKDPAVADDITQETLLRLTQRLHTLRDAERLETWVFQIARNAVTDHFRATKASTPFDEETHTSELESEAHEPLTLEDEKLRRAVTAYVASVVENLPEPYRGALQLTEFEGLSQVELAGKIGLSVSAAKSRVQRARTMLRVDMERCCRWETDGYGTDLDVRPKSADCCDRPRADA